MKELYCKVRANVFFLFGMGLRATVGALIYLKTLSKGALFSLAPLGRIGDGCSTLPALSKHESGCSEGLKYFLIPFFLKSLFLGAAKPKYQIIFAGGLEANLNC